MMVRINKLTKKVAKYIQIGLTKNKTRQIDQYAQLPAHRRYTSSWTPSPLKAYFVRDMYQKMTKKVAKYIQINNKTRRTDQYAQQPAHRRYTSAMRPEKIFFSNFRSCPSYFSHLKRLQIFSYACEALQLEQITKTKTNRTEDINDFEPLSRC